MRARCIRTGGAIHAHLEELKALRELWYKYGSDACYCGDEGDVE